MRKPSIGVFTAMMVILAVVSMASADVIRQDMEFESRPVVVLLPENYDDGSDLIPLVVHLHGALPFENAPDLELDASGYRDLPSKYRMMVVAPRASLNQALGLHAWDALLSLVKCGPIDSDDVGFLNRLLDKLLEDYPVDPKRVYIYGYSSGGAMAHRMACVNAERFAGIVAGASVILGEAPLCAPSIPISVLELHSLTDETVLFNGGNIGDFANMDPGNQACDYPGAFEVLTRWADLNACAGELQFGNKPKHDLTDFSTVPFPGGVEGKDTTVHKFKQCPNGIDVELWEMKEGIPHPPLFFRVGSNGIKVLAEKSWKFLRSHKR